MCFFPVQLIEPAECGNGYVEVGEECDCGVRAVSHCFAIGGICFFQVKVSVILLSRCEAVYLPSVWEMP